MYSAISRIPFIRDSNEGLNRSRIISQAQVESQERMNPEQATIFYQGKTPRYVELGNNIYQVNPVMGATSDLKIMSPEVKKFYNYDRLKNLAYDLNGGEYGVRTDRVRNTIGAKTDYNTKSPQLKGLVAKTTSLTD